MSIVKRYRKRDFPAGESGHVPPIVRNGPATLPTTDHGYPAESGKIDEQDDHNTRNQPDWSAVRRCTTGRLGSGQLAVGSGQWAVGSGQ
ncbi:MAG: hypothetical protein H7Z75_12305 [Ferruginibacter sp.]|nr:hypothetical protein [Cytophagales bacterium]